MVDKHNADPSSLSLTVTFNLTAHELQVHYCVRNKSARDIYLLNRLYKTIPSFTIDPNFIYIHLEKEKRTVHLVKRIPDIPAGKRVAAPVSPFVTPVRAKSEFSENVRILVPVREYRQYSAGAKGSGVEVTYQFVDLTLGYYWREEGTKEELRRIGNFQVVLPHLPPGKRPIFGELRTKPQRLPIKVLEMR
ncbi:MAG: hypothetical protein GXP27_06160 [Planctomycetes bacterium]|nr:hypothetical protein [Planctomycetota bacterium]